MRSDNEDFDWVKERAACTVAGLFERLRLQVESDVKTRQTLRPEGASYSFRVVNNNGSFSVFYDEGVIHRVIRFKLGDEKILVTYPNDKLMFEAVPILGDDGECRLRVNEKDRELWQVRMDALNDLFFKEV